MSVEGRDTCSPGITGPPGALYLDIWVYSRYTALHPRTAVSLIARSGLAPGGPCHLPAPVGTEVQPPAPGAGPNSAGVRHGQRGPPDGGLRQAPRHPPPPQPR